MDLAILILIPLLLVGGVLIAAVVGFVRSSSNQQQLSTLAREMRELRDRVDALALRQRSVAPTPGPDSETTTSGVTPAPPPVVSPVPVPRTSPPQDASVSAAPPPSSPPLPPRPVSPAGVFPPRPTPTPDTPSRVQAFVDASRRDETASATPGPTAAPKANGTEPPRGGSLEEALGGKVLVWIGGVALALAGAFLVKYSWDAGWLTAAMRLALGASFGVAMITAGSWIHRRAERVSAALAGAGVAVLYSVVFAATSVYGFFAPWVGFALMAGVTAAAVALSLRHGQFVAMLGLVGGFLTPALVGRSTEATGAMFGYLLVLQIGLVVVTRQRGWIGLSVLTLVGSVLWAGFEMLTGRGADDRLWTSGFLLASASVFILNAARIQAREATGTSRRLPAFAMAVSAIAAAAALVGLSAVRGGYAPRDLAMVAVLGAGSLVLARLDRRYLAMAWLTAGLGLALTAASRFNLPTDALMKTAAGFGTIYAVGGWCCAFRHARGTVFAVLAAVSGVAFLAIAALPTDWSSTISPVTWWAPAVVGALYAVGAWGLRREQAGARSALALVAAGMATWAVGMGFDTPWMIPTWAALVPLTCLAAQLTGQTASLRWAAVWNGVLAALGLCAAVFVRDWADAPTTLTLFGGSLVAFAFAGWRFARQDAPRFADVFFAAGAVAAWLGTTLLVHQGFHGRHTLAPPDGLTEWSVYTSLWLAFGAVVVWLGHRASLRAVAKTGETLGVLGLVLGLVGLGLFANPLLSAEPVGGLILLNRMLPAYGVPIVLLWAFGVAVRDESNGQTRIAAQGVALLGLGLLTVLQVRHGFHGDAMHVGEAVKPVLCEWATYAVGLLALGLLLAELGRRRPHATVAFAGLALLSVGLATTVIGVVGLGNPLWNGDHVGRWSVVNGLLYAYGVPALLAVAVAWRFAGDASLKPLRVAAGIVALVMVFALVNLEVRQHFTGPVLRLSGGPIDAAEWYAYSAAWAALGALLLLGGLALGSAAMRYGSLAVFLLAAGKVFILDTAQLDGLLRVASFLGLGLTLMALGFVYQRYVFRKPAVSSA